MQALHQALKPLGMELIETHISWVFLGSSLVYKVKKPVCFDFLDYSSLKKRRQACEAELALNKRLAPEVYLGLSRVTKEKDGLYGFDGEGQVVDFAVRMKRLPDAHRADLRLTCGTLGALGLALVAKHIAHFHSGAQCSHDIARFGTVEAVRANIEGNFTQTKDSIRDYLNEKQINDLYRWYQIFLDTHASLFQERMTAHRVRDGHGDLRLEHIYIDEQKRISILDCIEFNERFRFADVCADIAFVSMDLAWHGRVDLAEYFLSVYAQVSNDYGFYRLIDFYQSYRAHVRAKVASIVASDAHAQSSVREKSVSEARRYYLLALASARSALSKPCVIAIGGVIASGKSSLADALSQKLGLAVVQSDRVRKHLLGVDPTTPLRDEAFKGSYAEAKTKDVYATLFSHAEKVLQSNRAVILDASFADRAQRKGAAELAQAHHVPYHFVRCTASRAVCMQRLKARQTSHAISDGRREIFDAHTARWQALSESESLRSVSVDTTTNLSSSVEHLCRALGL